MTTFPTLKEFRQWLRSLPPEQEVAPARYSCTCCPLANYMNSQGHQYAYISPAPAELDRGVWRITDPVFGVELHPLPKWANEFAIKADTWASKKPYNNGFRFAPITAHRALLLLRGIKEQ